MDLREFAVKTDNEGLGYALTNYWSDSDLRALAAADPQLAQDCLEAREILTRIENRVATIIAAGGQPEPTSETEDPEELVYTDNTYLLSDMPPEFADLAPDRHGRMTRQSDGGDGQVTIWDRPSRSGPALIFKGHFRRSELNELMATIRPYVRAMR